ncbi:MAG: porin [Rhabdaerophilum sp.]
MKLVKSLLLGSAAGLVAVAGASAADLGVKKPTAVEYVKTCPQYGAGFFVVPGTTSCLKIIGRVRADYIFNNDLTRTADKNTFRARGYFGYDHRTATEYGLLRTYVRGFIGRDNAGAYAPVMEYAFIQFGGLTVGRITPVFEHGYANLFNGSGTFGGFSDISYVNSFGYTFQFGGGFSATVALDAARERQVGIAGTTYGGQAMPDVVASLDYAGSWGSAKLAGAVHQIRDGVNPPASTKYGYALTAAAKINLPMISRGSNIWFNGTYAEGAVSYAGFGSTMTIGGQTTANSDATWLGPIPGSLRLTKAWSLSGGLEVFAAPTVRLGLYGTYGSIDRFGPSNTVTTYSVWGQAAWLPTAGFLIGAEVGYLHMSGRRFGAGAPITAAAGGDIADRSNWTGRVRFQRDF